MEENQCSRRLVLPGNQRCEVILIVYVINDQKISVSQGTTVVLHIYIYSTDIEEFINQNV